MAAVNALWQAGEATSALRLIERAIEFAGGDPTMGAWVMGSPLAVCHALRGAVSIRSVWPELGRSSTWPPI